MMRGWLAIAPLFWVGVALAAPRLDLAVDLDPAARMLRVVADLAPEQQDFQFELHESLAVGKVTAGDAPVRFEVVGRDGDRRRWRLRAPAEARLRIEYGGTLPGLDRGLDHRGVLHRLPPMASPEGSFLPASGAWYPSPGRLFTYRVALSLPSGQRGLVAGRLLREDVVGPAGRYLATYEFSQPSDGIDLMAGPYVVTERLLARSQGGPLRLRTWFFPGMEGLAGGYLDDSAGYIQRYSAEIGAYPFSEFSVVASPLPTGFGMPTLTYLGADVLRLPFIRATSLGHEVLHNWWGNGVYVDYQEGNWSEGLTTFMADYAYKEEQSAEAARAMRLGWLRDFAAVGAQDQQTLRSFRSRTHGAAAAVGYGKSAMLFVMLRDLLGAAAFGEGIRRFWRLQQFKAASWSDLQDAFEQASGRSLSGFFAQWLERTGGPSVRIAEARTGRRPGQLRLTLEQDAPPYRLRVPLEISAGGTPQTRVVDLARSRQEFTLDLPGPADGVRLDPDLRLWRLLDAEQLPAILRQWVIAPAPRVVIANGTADAREAARALATRFFEAAPQVVGAADIRRPGGPLLLVGLREEVEALLAGAGIKTRPGGQGQSGTAQVWTVWDGANLGDAAPLAVVSARDAASLKALLRPLPHYGAQSWVVFEGARALERGVWPAPGRLMPVSGSP